MCEYRVCEYVRICISVCARYGKVGHTQIPQRECETLQEPECIHLRGQQQLMSSFSLAWLGDTQQLSYDGRPAICNTHMAQSVRVVGCRWV